MADTPAVPPLGSIAWADLTVPDADGLRSFYEAVAGWRSERVPMTGYSDFMMYPADGGTAAAGICHARGTNADLPAQWLMYVVVESLERSMERCRTMGGTVIAGPKGSAAQGTYCVIRDPAGAVVALFEPPPSPSALPA